MELPDFCLPYMANDAPTDLVRKGHMTHLSWDESGALRVRDISRNIPNTQGSHSSPDRCVMSALRAGQSCIIGHIRQA